MSRDQFSFSLIDFSSDPLLKLHFSIKKAETLQQFEYLQDLKESGTFIHDFIKEYPIPYQNDRKFIFELVKSYPVCIDYLSDEYYTNVEFAKYCLEIGIWARDREIPKQVENDIETIRKALYQNIELYALLSDNVKSQFTIEEILQMPSVDNYFISQNFKDDDFAGIDRNVLIYAIDKGLIRNYLDFNDRELVLLFIKQNRANIRIVKPNLDWENDQQAFDALVFPKKTWFYSGRHKKHVTILECVKYELSDNREFVLRIIEHDPKSFEFCSKRLQADKEIALIAISKDMYQINHIKWPLSNDREVMTKALDGHAQFYGKASEELKSDKEFILYALKSHNPSMAAQYIDQKFYNDQEIRDLIIRSGYLYNLDDLSNFTRDQVIDCVRENCFNLSKFPQYFTDEEVLVSCVKSQSYALKKIPVEYRTFDLCMIAIQDHPSELSECKDCPFFDELVLACCKHSTPYSYYFPRGYKFKSIEQFKEIMPYDVEGELFDYAPYEMQSDREIVLHYVKLKGKNFQSVSSELASDPIIKKEAVKHGLRKRPFIPLK